MRKNGTRNFARAAVGAGAGAGGSYSAPQGYPQNKRAMPIRHRRGHSRPPLPGREEICKHRRVHVHARDLWIA